MSDTSVYSTNPVVYLTFQIDAAVQSSKQMCNETTSLSEAPESGLPWKHVKVKSESYTWEQFMLQGTTGSHQVHIPLKAGL